MLSLLSAIVLPVNVPKFCAFLATPDNVFKSSTSTSTSSIAACTFVATKPEDVLLYSISEASSFVATLSSTYVFTARADGSCVSDAEARVVEVFNTPLFKSSTTIFEIIFKSESMVLFVKVCS